MKTISRLFILCIVAGGVYLGLGYFELHSYWIPFQGNADTESVKEDLKNLSPKKLIEKERFREAEIAIRKKLKEGVSKEDLKQEYHYLLGVAYKHLDQKEDAVSNFEQFLETGPPDAKAGLANFHLATLASDKTKQDRLFRKAALLDPRGKAAEKVAEEYKTAMGDQLGTEQQLFHYSLQFIHKTQPGDAKRKTLLNKLKPISKEVFRSGKPYFDGMTYTVQSGESLSRIAKRYDIGPGWINYTNNRPLPVRGNRRASNIMAGQKLIIYPSHLFIEVSIQETRMYLFYKDLLFVHTYLVGIGDPEDSPSPTGTFPIVDKTMNPSWTPPGESKVIPYGDPDNILGTRWMAFGGERGKSYGIHGTTEPETIGKKVSGGCIRMRNNEVEQLYDMLPTSVSGPNPPRTLITK